MDNSAESLAGLSLAEKRLLLARLLQEKIGRSGTFPLSVGQRGLWFLYQMDRDSAAYNASFPGRIRSPLDLPAFRRALQTLVDRHPSLRTTFEEKDGQLLQRVHETMEPVFEVVDAAGWDEAELNRRVEAEAHRPFDLERGPLVRVHLFSRAPDDHVFLLSVHHIIGDFWSLVVLVAEMQILYPAERDGKPVSLPPLPHPFRDFVRWQADMLAGPEGERLRAYWERQLAGAPHVLEWPADRPRPPVLGSHGGAVPIHIEPAIARRVKDLAAAEQVTPYSVLLAVFQALLGRYSGQDDFLLGSPFVGRTRPGFESVVGYFINMVPLRADLRGDPTFRALLHRVGPTVLDALQHQDYPFPLLVERLGVRRDLSRTPLVQVSFTLEKAHRAQELGGWRFFLSPEGARSSLGGLQVEHYPVEHRASQGDLEMVLEEGDGGIDGLLRYNSDLFDRATVQRMIGHFITLLAGAVASPERRLSELPWFTADERRQVVEEWNRTTADFPTGLCLHDFFEQQAARSPEAVAVSAEGRSLTYAELQTWTNRLAHRLRRRGVGPGTLVALCLERSPEMIAGILGVLKAGAAYVPLDPASPAERLRLLLDDVRAPVLLTQRRLVGRLQAARPAETAVEIIALDDPEPADETGEGPPESGVQSGDLAYVIFTSGSTGRPKGVMVEHRAICNTILWRQRDMAVRSDDRVMLNVSYCFDPSLCIIFPTLAAGACLVLAEPGEEADPVRLLQRAARERVTVLEVPVPLLRPMLDGPFRESCQQVRWACTGGEVLPPDLPPRIIETLGIPFFNLYGPTETAVDTTWWSCRHDETRAAVPIGRPIANVRVYVLDERMQPVPVGVAGELYIGGAGLSRGYLNDPVKTAESFLHDPFSGEPGSRLYRTGDRCRWLPDGVLEFLGRVDHQVKVRGYRIELGEIEVVLAGHPSVLEAAVTLHPGVGGPRLIAHVVGREGSDAPTAEVLRRHLKEHLPDYMVPAVFVVLAALPRMPSGKVDRRALTPPAIERPALAQGYVAPRTPLEELLARLWREVLGLAEVGVEDNFFELGGNSVQAAMLINRLHDRLGRHVSTVALFDSPTVAGLAQFLDRGQGGTTKDEHGEAGPSPSSLLVPLQREGGGAPCFMVHPPGGIVVCYQPLARHLGRERPFFGIRSRGLHGETTLPGTLEEMAAEYVAAIRAVRPEGPYHLGGWSVGGLVALEVARQLLAAGQEVGLLALLDTTLPAGQAREAGEIDSGREYGLDVTLEELSRLGPDEQLPYLWQHALRLGLIEPDTPLQLAQQVLDDLKRLFHHHLSLADRYEVCPYPGRITLFRPAEMPFAVPTQPDRGWGRLAAAVDVHVVPGHHHSMVKEPHAQVLADKLRECLHQAEASRSRG
jgi:amino acid adenylation domain-containing protein